MKKMINVWFQIVFAGADLFLEEAVFTIVRRTYLPRVGSKELYAFYVVINL